MDSIVFHGFEKFWGQGVWRPVPPCRNGLDPPNIKISDSGGLGPETWCLDAGCWKEWNGLEEVTEVTEGWEEGIGRNSYTLKLQELGGLHVICMLQSAELLKIERVGISSNPPPIPIPSVTSVSSVTSSNPFQSCQHPGIQAQGL